MFKKLLKNQKGLTLIELLVVVVILGIIAAIAIPSIGGLITNSKVDAHIANAQQMINSARLAAASEGITDGTLDLNEHLIGDGYLEPIENPFTDGVYASGSVTISDGVYTVTLRPGSGYSEYNIEGRTQAQLNRDDYNGIDPDPDAT